MLGSISKIMRTLQDRAESNSEDDVDDDYFSSEEAVGWNARTELDRYAKSKDVNRKKIVQAANRLIPLSSVIFKYNIAWERKEGSDWSYQARCPFPDHDDSTPSFGFNSKQERFHCFGCNKSGNTVQFIAFMTRRNMVDVATDLLAKHKSSEELLIELEADQVSKSNELLKSFALDVRNFLYRHENNDKALTYIENIMWNLSVYLERHIGSGSMQTESLLARLNKMRDKMNLFGVE